MSFEFTDPLSLAAYMRKLEERGATDKAGDPDHLLGAFHFLGLTQPPFIIALATGSHPEQTACATRSWAALGNKAGAGVGVYDPRPAEGGFARRIRKDKRILDDNGLLQVANMALHAAERARHQEAEPRELGFEELLPLMAAAAFASMELRLAVFEAPDVATASGMPRHVEMLTELTPADAARWKPMPGALVVSAPQEPGVAEALEKHCLVAEAKLYRSEQFVPEGSLVELAMAEVPRDCAHLAWAAWQALCLGLDWPEMEPPAACAALNRAAL